MKNEFFKIEFPNGKSIVVVSKNGYAGLIGLINCVQDKENTYIIPISLFEFIKYIIGGFKYEKKDRRICN